MRNILVVYAYHRYPIRKALWNHLYCFEKSPQCRAFYINLRYRSISDWLLNMKFDAVIFETTFTGQRWGRDQFRKVARKAAPIKQIDAPKYIIPQDEFLNTDLLCEFVEEFGIDRVYTSMPRSAWQTVYGSVYPEKTDLEQVLTGYLDDEQVQAINDLATEVPRELDIAYRASSQPWFGRHGMEKSWMAETIERAAKERGLATDISGEQKTEKDRLHGDDWFRFLLGARYTIGAEGGTSIHDRDGTIRKATEEFLERNPEASFLEVEEACFPGEDGKNVLHAISPRHLEACVTRTCQILVESTYNGILKPGLHYIELKPDYSNLDEVLELVSSDDRRQEITERAYRDVVESGAYSYEVFVGSVLREITDTGSADASLWQRWLAHPYMRLRDTLSWVTVWFVDTYFTPKH